MLFQSGKLKVRELENKDAALLAKWLSNPAVLEFYEGRDCSFDLEKVRDVFFTSDSGETRCIVLFEDQEIGYIQFYELAKSDCNNFGLDISDIIYGTDQFIGETEYWNKGIGQILMRSMLDYLLGQKGADLVVVDPQTWNERAIACYAKVGFTKYKLLPKHEWHEGELRDSWLMQYKTKKC